VKSILRNSLTSVTPPTQTPEMLYPSSARSAYAHSGYKGIEDLKARVLAAQLAQCHIDQTKGQAKKVTFDEQHLAHTKDYERGV
jgi:hypothetical protein